MLVRSMLDLGLQLAVLWLVDIAYEKVLDQTWILAGKGGFREDGSFFQYAFLDESNAWFEALRKVREPYLMSMIMLLL